MAGDKKQSRKSSSQKAEAPGIEEPSGADDAKAKTTEPPAWSLLTVKPKLQQMFASPPESGIGKRIAYCRGQLDNLQVEALARYTKNFDATGISRTTIVRYESGENIPGGRELRILCEALWVPPNWLLRGDAGDGSVDADELDAVRSITRLIRKKSGGDKGLDDGFDDRLEEKETEKRQKWMAEARKPQPKA